MPAALHPFAVNQDVEVLIAGGGLIGLLLGIACAGAGLEVAIADPTDPVAVLGENFDSAINFDYSGHPKHLLDLTKLESVKSWQLAQPLGPQKRGRR